MMQVIAAMAAVGGQTTPTTLRTASGVRFCASCIALNLCDAADPGAFPFLV